MSKPLTDEQRTRAMALLSQEVARINITRAALRIGMDRATVSLVVRGVYKASPDRVLTKVLATLDRRACPYLGAEVQAEYCRETNTGPTPTWDPSALTQRRICQTCEYKEPPCKPQ